MTNAAASGASSVRVLPLLLFGTRFISGLIFRPRDGSEHGSEVHEAVEEECGEEDFSGAHEELEEELPVQVEQQYLEESLKEGPVKQLEYQLEEEEEEEVEESSIVDDEREEVNDEDVVKKAWETLSLPSVVPSDLSEDTMASALPLDPCSRTVLLEQWLRSLSLCQAPGFLDRFPVSSPEEVEEVPTQPVDLEVQMQRTNMFTNPIFFSLTPRMATPRSSTPRAITPCSAGGLRTRKKNAQISPIVEPLVLRKKKQTGAMTSRSEAATQNPPDIQAQKREKNLSTISVIATPRQVWAPGQTSLILSSNAWVRARANPGLEFNPYQRSSKPGLKSFCRQSSCDSVEATC